MRFLLLILFFNFSLFALELETNSYLVMKKKTVEKVKKYGAKNTLLVLDIDNTTLQMSQNFGSDQWWNWQSNNCIGKKDVPKFCVTNSFSELLDIQGQIFALSNMKPTELATVKTIKDIQAMGVKVILLTSRGPDFRNATERALSNNNLNFSASAIGPKGGYGVLPISPIN
jgi:predicted secreted acid phosphatase